MNLDLQSTWLLQLTLDALTRYVVHEGGTRSSKTISLCQWIILYALSNPGETISIARKSFPALRISAMRDFFDVLGKLGLYDENQHAKMTNSYLLNGTTIEFMSVDDPQKKRGSGRDVLWINEANELTEDDARQLALRTRKKIILDYNPSGGERHWIRRNVLTLPPEELTVIRSTYLDNPFLPPEQVKEIERLKEQDPVAWSVFGLGEWAQLKGLIYQNWKSVNEWPGGQSVYGLDFGFTNPMALVEVTLRDEGLYWREVVYETNLHEADLIERMKSEGVKRGATIYCDSAEPDRIQGLKRAGYNAVPARKDVMAGIDFCRKHRIHAVDSGNLEEEISGYKMRQDRDGTVLEEPVKRNDHLMDAARYATYTHYWQPPSKTEYKTVSKREAKFGKGGW